MNTVLGFFTSLVTMAVLEGLVGSALAFDFDKDGVPDHNDVCPNYNDIHTSDFSLFSPVTLDEEPGGQGQVKFSAMGTDKVIQNENSKPGLIFVRHKIAGLNYDGTFKIDDSGVPTNDQNDDDYVGFIFGYEDGLPEDAKSFYVVMWRRKDQTHFECDRSSQARAGITIKRVYSNTGPSCALQNGLWSSDDTLNQVKVLWEEPNYVKWVKNTEYHWRLVHRPRIGLINVKFLTTDIHGKEYILANSGNIYDDNIKKGHLGLYCHSQAGITWSNLKYNCDDHGVPRDIYDDLLDVLKPDVTTYPRGHKYR